LLGFFEKKILKPLPKFFRPYKKISKTPPKKISGYAPEQIKEEDYPYHP